MGGERKISFAFVDLTSPRGGLEILFNHERQIKLALSAEGRNPTVRDLIKKLADEHINERKELFIEGDTV